MAVLEEKCRLEAEFERQDGEMEALGSLANVKRCRKILRRMAGGYFDGFVTVLEGSTEPFRAVWEAE